MAPFDFNDFNDLRRERLISCKTDRNSRASAKQIVRKVKSVIQEGKKDLQTSSSQRNRSAKALQSSARVHTQVKPQCASACVWSQQRSLNVSVCYSQMAENSVSMPMQQRHDRAIDRREEDRAAAAAESGLYSPLYTLSVIVLTAILTMLSGWLKNLMASVYRVKSLVC